MPKIPIYNNAYSPKYEKKKVRLEEAKQKYRDEWRYTKDEIDIIGRLAEINRQMFALRVEKSELSAVIKRKKLLRKQGRALPVKLYVLELEDGCWYIGMSYNPEKRFVQHTTGKGAAWTRLHKPMKIHEVRLTTFYDQDPAAKLEDDLTLEYALKYGSQFVRGGGWCQKKPVWPDLIRQNELLNVDVIM